MTNTLIFRMVRTLCAMSAFALGACSQSSVTSRLPMPEPKVETVSSSPQVKVSSEHDLNEDFSTNSRMRKLGDYQDMIDERGWDDNYMRSVYEREAQRDLSRSFNQDWNRDLYRSRRCP